MNLMSPDPKSDFSLEDDALLAELGIEVEAKKASARTPREERIIAGFEDIQRFVEQTGRLPSMAEGNDIFERIYATRLLQLRSQQECRDLLADLDAQGILDESLVQESKSTQDLSDGELLAELGGALSSDQDLTILRHVQPRADKRAAEDIANRSVCEDFATFGPLFKTVQHELETGIRITRPFEKKSEIEPGRFFIVGGQKAYVAEMEEPFLTAQGMTDARLRVIFDNGTQSNMLLRSLQRALHKDEAGRRISEPSAGPLFADTVDQDDISSGTIYVLRSKSQDPQIQKNRRIIHKIGVTQDNVEKRIANAARDPTFLLAEVEIIATYQLFNINRVKLENLIHTFFESARLDIQIKDRFGNPVDPREWFLVPLPAIEETVKRIMDGTIVNYRYDPETASLIAQTKDDGAETTI